MHSRAKSKLGLFVVFCGNSGQTPFLASPRSQKQSHYAITKYWIFTDIYSTTAKVLWKLNTIHQRFLCKLLHINYPDHISYQYVLKMAGSTRLQDIVAEHRFRLEGHILCLPDHWHSKAAMRWTPAGGRGRTKKTTWRHTFQEDLGEVHLTTNKAEVMASYRSYWWQAAAQCAAWKGLSLQKD